MYIVLYINDVFSCILHQNEGGILRAKKNAYVCAMIVLKSSYLGSRHSQKYEVFK